MGAGIIHSHSHQTLGAVPLRPSAHPRKSKVNCHFERYTGEIQPTNNGSHKLARQLTKNLIFNGVPAKPPGKNLCGPPLLN
mgnify:CR=1 FL=1